MCERIVFKIYFILLYIYMTNIHKILIMSVILEIASLFFSFLSRQIDCARDICYRILIV